MSERKRRRSAVKIMASLIGLIKPMLPIMCAAILLGVLGFAAAEAIPILGAVCVLSVSGIDTGIGIGVCFALLIAFGIVRGLLHYGEQACNHYIAFRILAEIRDKVFAALRRLAPAKLEGRDKGNLISVITSDIELLEVFYAHTISPIAIALLMSVINIAFICAFSPAGAAVAAAAYVTVGAVIPMCNSARVSAPGMEYREASGGLNTLFLDTLRGFSELIGFDKLGLRRGEIDAETETLNRVHSDLKKKERANSSITDAAIFAFNIIMLLANGALAAAGLIPIFPAVIACVTLIGSYGPVTALSKLSSSLAQTLASGERVLSLLEEVPQTEDIKNGRDVAADDIDCRDVRFAYENELILENVSLTAKPGEITGIYGASGCGKSTLLKLIMRFWDKSGGSIRLSGTDVSEINTESLRENESYCTQETYLFNDTIANNIRLAKPDATDAELDAAVRAASLSDFIAELPEGLNTRIGELGGRLSGGEKQRIGIARAMLSDARLMLLDEPTSNLDSLNEAVILRSLERTEGKTIVLVSHRKSTLAAADRVYSLENTKRRS